VPPISVPVAIEDIAVPPISMPVAIEDTWPVTIEILGIIYKSCDFLQQFQIIKDLYEQDEEGELKDLVNELGMTKGAKYIQDVVTVKEKTNVRIFII
jgi:hypothetical protein